jgi:hypothetical protein
MKPIFSKETIRDNFYANSPFDLATEEDDIYRNNVDDLLDNKMFDSLLDIIYDNWIK